MSATLHACLYNAETEASEERRSQIEALNFVRLVTEVTAPEHLIAALEESGIGLVFFYVGRKAAPVLELIDQVSRGYPELALIALGHATEPEAILAPIRAGCDQYVCEPIDYADLAAAVARVASKKLLQRGKSRCVCVVAASGGMGATSIACNLAIELAAVTEKRCALMDLDLQFGDVAAQFDCEPEYTLHDVAVSTGQLDRAVLEKVLTDLPCHVSLLPRPEEIEQYEEVTSEVVHDAIELLLSMFETVVIDVPKRLDSVTFAALGRADLIVLVCQLLVPNIRNTNRFFEAMKKAGIATDRIEVVVNRDDSSGGRITTKDLENIIQKPIFARIPNDYHFVAQSLDFGQPIAGEEKGNPVRTELRKIAKQIVTDSGPNELREEPRRGFLGRFLSK